MGPTKQRRGIRAKTLSAKDIDAAREKTREELKPQAEAFKQLCLEVLGKTYKTRLKRTGYHYATIMRWFSADLPIPPIMWVLFSILKATPSRYWEDIYDGTAGRKPD